MKKEIIKIPVKDMIDVYFGYPEILKNTTEPIDESKIVSFCKSNGKSIPRDMLVFPFLSELAKDNYWMSTVTLMVCKYTKKEDWEEILYYIFRGIGTHSREAYNILFNKQ